MPSSSAVATAACASSSVTFSYRLPIGAPPKPSGETCTPRPMVCAAAMTGSALQHHDAVDGAGGGGRHGQQRLAAEIRQLHLVVTVALPRGLDAGNGRQYQVRLLPGEDVHKNTVPFGSGDAPASRGDGTGARAVNRIAMSAQPGTDRLQPLDELRLHLAFGGRPDVEQEVGVGARRPHQEMDQLRDALEVLV